MLEIHNSLTGRKEPFEPLTPGRVRMYVCGVTVYDYCHLGHARMLIAFDVVRRYIEFSGYDVEFVRNITDMDDKIIARAHENGEPTEALTERFIRAYHEDCEALGVAMPTQEPRATEYVGEIIAMIATLVDKGYAYAAGNGDVYYAVGRFKDYGRLSGKRLTDLRAGARIEGDEPTGDPLDFVLWKAAKPGEPSWESPWGRGRPGWHIECSAMSTQLLGSHFDIHGGGMDLKFPHHENEIAQSCAACDAPFVNVWMHNGFVRVDDEKMSKSLGNFFTIRDVLKLVRDPEVIRYMLVASHYRGPINYTEDSLEQADAALERLYLALRGVQPAADVAATDASDAFRKAMDDDFNTPQALAVLYGLATDLNKAKAEGRGGDASLFAAELRTLGAVLGLAQQDPEKWLRKFKPQVRSAALEIQGQRASVEVRPALSSEDIDRMVEARRAARAGRDFKEADRIRDELSAEGIVLEDGPQGTTWRRG
ncbi:MAG TPA: cysteine--tRNA ligase [Steroidobacteraceae bacterium]|nr:cysteine--tRNA ligase [Steroidobacteraceae bacterium]